MHRHHILPKRLGGTDDEENLTPPISTALHALFHKDLYEYYGQMEDYIAWKALEGRITSEEARLMAAKEGQKRSSKYQNKCSIEQINSIRTHESCSKGGKEASKSLVKWIEENKEKHREQCSENGKKNPERKCIPHKYKGIVYPSKKELQHHTGLSNTPFYTKLRKGEIERLPKEDRLINQLEEDEFNDNS